MASYPGAVKTFTTRNAGDVIQPSHINDLQDEVNAIEGGLLQGTAPLNSSNSTVANLSVTGKSTLASTLTIGTLPMIFPAAGGSTGQALIISSTSGSTMTLAWGTITGALSLLYANSGTSSAAGATTVDSIALGGLTAKDSLLVLLNSQSGSTTVTGVQLYHVNDAVTLSLATNMNASQSLNGTIRLFQDQASSTQVAHYSDLYESGGGGGRGAGLITGLTTAWTSTWTLGLRHGGAGGIAWKYRWSVYKIAGQ